MAICDWNSLPAKLPLHTNAITSPESVRTEFATFNIGDVEDPMIYLGPQLQQWKESEQGQWCLQHAEGEIIMYSMLDGMMWGYRVSVQGFLSSKNLTYFKLKWPTVDSNNLSTKSHS